MRYVRISTFCFSAESSAFLSGRTLKPMISAFDAAASITSPSVIPPTAVWMMFTRTSSFDSFSSDCFTASAEPPTSAFTMMLRSLTPSEICANRSLRLTFAFALNCSSFVFSRRCSASSRAMRSSSTAANSSPDSGTSARPMISTGTDGPADFTFLPLSSVIARTRPTAVPAMTMSPLCSVPFCTSTVATGPRPRSSFASMTRPFARRFGFALSSFMSATSSRFSSRSSRPSPVTAETGTQITSPPHSSGTRLYLVSSCFTLSGFAPGLSILFIATTISIPAAFA